MEAERSEQPGHFLSGGLNTSDMTQKRKKMRVSTSLGKNSQ